MCTPGLAAMANDPERIKRNRAIPSFPTTFRQAGLKSEAVQEPEESLEAAFESVTEGPPFKLTIGKFVHWQSTHPSSTRRSHWN